MASKNYNLKATTSPKHHLASMLNYFINLPTIPYTDLTIHSEHSSIELHSCILSSASSMISSLLSSIPPTSPHPYLLDMTSISPHISIPHISSKNYSLILARELMYTGYCMGTQNEMEEVLELLLLLGVRDLNQICMEEALLDFEMGDTLDIVMEEDSGRSKLKESNIEQKFENFEDVTGQTDEEHMENDCEKVAVRETEPELILICKQADNEKKENQFPQFYCNSKLEINPVKLRKLRKVYMKKANQSVLTEEPYVKSNSFFCTHCHIMFSRTKDKEMHALLEHSYELPFICMECGARFKVKKDIEQHVTSHVGGNYKIKCEVCEQVCKTISMYHTHYKVHSGLREFGCSKCSSSFATLHTLRRHEHIHKPGKFACDQCDRLFHRGENMRTHKKKKH